MQSSQEVLVDVAQLISRVMVQKTANVELPTGEPLTTDIRGTGSLRYPHVKVLHGDFPGVVANLTQCEVGIECATEVEDGYVECDMFNYVEEYGQFPEGVRMSVSVTVSRAIFDTLTENLAGPQSKCTLYFKLPDWQNKFTTERDYASVRAVRASVHLENSIRLVASAQQDPEDNKYHHAIASRVFTKSWSLRYRIGAELAAGLAKQDMPTTRWDAIETMREIMDHLVGSFHTMEQSVAEGIPENLFRSSPSEFLAQISDLPKELADRLTSSYDRVWVHVPISQVLQTGEAATELRSQRLVADVEGIEELARLYCEHKQLRSPLLEWAIVDALIYSETIGFARILLSQTQFLGMPLAVPLEPVGHWKRVRKSFVESAWKLLDEAIVLAVTASAASIANAVSESGFWPIFWGITAVRWLRKKDDPKVAIRAKNFALLSDMASAHQCLKTYDFNAALLKTHLHALEIRGAVFSVTVYNVLEKRLSNE
ncbi:hypothetical protein ACEN9F_10945 [Duganella sp. CT11-25]|uniref:hypothetical protein n=1 Tax=unclassified Duganella TaxID=2636909 RepID=UPI0039AF587C